MKKHARFLRKIHYFGLLIKKHKIASVHLMFTKEQIHMGETQCKNTLIYWELFITIHGNKKDTKQPDICYSTEDRCSALPRNKNTRELQQLCQS